MNAEIKCLVLDDEPRAIDVLDHYINLTPGLKMTGRFRNAIEAFEFIKTNQVDLLFLDVEMPLVNGVNFLRSLISPPKTIFTSAYRNYAVDGFELQAVDYLLKPFSFDRFLKAIEKAKNIESKISTGQHQLLLKDGKQLINLFPADIIYIQGYRDYVKVYTDKEMHVIYHTLKGIYEKLDGTMFVQSHRSYIINKKRIWKINQDHLLLSNHVTIPIGKFHRKELLRLL